MITPYYDHAGITIYHARCEDVLPMLGPADIVFTDPPYGANKAEWDTTFDISWLPLAARCARRVLAITPGVPNLLSLPRTIDDLEYRWMLSVRIINGMTRGPFGFGNWIPCAVYARPDVSLFGPVQDATDIATSTTKSTMPKHASPKPYKAMRWIMQRLPGSSVIDPMMGSGTTLVVAKHLQMTAVGIDQDERCCEEAARRLMQEVLPLEMVG